MLRIVGVIAVPVVTIAGTIAALLFVVPMVTGKSIFSDGGSAGAAPVETVIITVPQRGITYSLGERIVNLADPGAFRYLKAEIVIEVVVDGVDPAKLQGEELGLAREELASELAPLDPEIQDVITLLLSSKSVADVATPEGKAALKAELLDALAAVVGEDRLLDVYFTQFVIQ